MPRPKTKPKNNLGLNLDLYESLPAMCWVLDRAGQVNFVNHLAATHLGYEPATLIGRSILDTTHPGDRDRLQHELITCFQTPIGTHHQWDFRQLCISGAIVWMRVSATVSRSPDRLAALETLILCHDITEFKPPEAPLSWNLNRQATPSEAFIPSGLEQPQPSNNFGFICNHGDRPPPVIQLDFGHTLSDQILQTYPNTLYIYRLTEQHGVYCNQQMVAMLGYSLEDIKAMGSQVLERLVYPDDMPSVREHLQRLSTIRADEMLEIEYRMQHANGSWRWLHSREVLFQASIDGVAQEILGTVQDISDRKHTETLLHQQAQRERILREIAQHIRRSLNLHDILNTTVIEVRTYLQASRVVISQFEPNGRSLIQVESLTLGLPSMLGWAISDPMLTDSFNKSHAVCSTKDIYELGLEAGQLQLLEFYNIRAEITVPILQDNTLWGLIIAHQCDRPREWQGFEIELLEQIAIQAGIAIQQAELYQQVRRFNADLEQQVEERTAQLQRSLAFEALLKRITDKVRDSLDEHQMLQAVVVELAAGLETECCDAGIYSADHATSTIAYECVKDFPSAQGWVISLLDPPVPEVFQQLQQGQSCQFCFNVYNTVRTGDRRVTVLTCPIVDDQGILGDLWLYKQPYEQFSPLETRLVEQVANQCAIALRQSRLYQAAQAQVEALEHLNRLKDDFLSTLSHELRTPLTSIKMSIQLMELLLKRMGVVEAEVPSKESSKVEQCLTILQEECDREISIINDLLTMQQLEAGEQSIVPSTIQLQQWIPEVVEIYLDDIAQQQQTLQLTIPPDLPAIVTDLNLFNRILGELLTNACKFTPISGTITISAELVDTARQQETHQDAHPSGSLPLVLPPFIQICITNTGKEIPTDELQRIFDKFYRIPNNDPWKHSGTGLGLALVQKIATRLGGAVHAEINAGQNCFIVKLPLQEKLGYGDRHFG